MMMNPCVIHTRSQEEALTKERHLKEALTKERHLEAALTKERNLSVIHQQLMNAGGKITGHLQALLKKNMALNMTDMNLISKQKMKSWNKQQPFGKVKL